MSTEAEKVVTVFEAWKLLDQRIIAELQHRTAGLQQGLMLRSRTNGQAWKVKSRLIYNHVGAHHVRFPIETEQAVSLSFASVASMETSAAEIRQKETLEIYRYELYPMQHNDKPTMGDELEIEQTPCEDSN